MINPLTRLNRSANKGYPEDRMTVAHTLASFACDTTRLTPAARTASVRAVFDLIAAAIAGSKTSGGIAALKAAPAIAVLRAIPAPRSSPP